MIFHDFFMIFMVFMISVIFEKCPIFQKWITGKSAGPDPRNLRRARAPDPFDLIPSLLARCISEPLVCASSRPFRPRGAPDGASGAEMTDPTVAVVLNGGAGLACHADLRSRIVFR